MTRPFVPLILLLAVWKFASADQTGQGSTGDEAVINERPIVIVHGAWGGAHHWGGVDDRLTRVHGRSVRRVSLTGLGERSHLVSPDVHLDTHVRDVVNLIEFEDLHSVVLVAHSYGGVVATGVADAIPDRLSEVILIDSHVLENGECYLSNRDELRVRLTRRAAEDGDGWLIPVDWKNTVRDTPHPLATLTDPLMLRGDLPKTIRLHYWLLTDGGEVREDDRFRDLERAKKRGWSTRVFPWNHNPHRDRPDELVRELVRTLK